MKVRFAPSPTGYLHVGNVRTALVNWLFAKSGGGEFLLRMDDTDQERSKPEYEKGIEEDLTWLGLKWDSFARQLERMERYELAKQKLIESGRLYPCFETAEELEVKRKMQLSRGIPPIYDRAALQVSDTDILTFEKEDRKPHYRFLLSDEPVKWHDKIRGEQSFASRSFSDPILFREDGVPTYTLSSVVDDGELGITHIIRGEDHVSNTAVQIQIFEALGFKTPEFAHLALLRTKEGEMSKREGGNDIRSLRAEGLEPMAILCVLARIGTSQPVEALEQLSALAKGFDFAHFGRAPAHYDKQEVERINAKLVSHLGYGDALPRLEAMGVKADSLFWEAIKGNLTKLADVALWWNICRQDLAPVVEDPAFLAQAMEHLPPEPWSHDTWGAWTKAVGQATGRKGKDLFMPLRKALTGLDHGPELKELLPLIGRERAMKRLKGETA